MPRGEYALFYENSHERDGRVVFEEEAHKYFVDGKLVSLSVSGLWGRYFSEFDARKTVDKFFSAWASDPHGKYYTLIRFMSLVLGYSEEEQKGGILSLWSQNGTSASEMGTTMHANIEKHLNGEEVDDPSDEFAQFLQWRKDFLAEKELAPYRTEWSVFDEALEETDQATYVPSSFSPRPASATRSI